MESTDLELIEGCKKGDPRAQKALYERYRMMLFGVCLRYASCREEAEDFLQDGFVKIYQNLYQYQPIGSLGGWMRKVVVNVILQHLRRRRHLFTDVEIEDLADQYEAEDQIFSSFRARALMRMVQQLPDGYRTVFNLYVIEGFSHKEIAEQLGISEATSKSQLSRAKSTLRKMIEKVV